MKFTIDRNTCADAITWIARYLPNRPTIPVLSGIMITAKESQIVLDVFDCEVSAQEKLSANMHQEGVVLVSGKLLTEIIRSLPNTSVDFQLEDSYLKIHCANSRFMLPTMYVLDFPLLPTLSPPAGSIETTIFAGAISQVIGAASKDDTLPMLTGVKIDFKPEKIVLAATDRFRLAVKEIPWNADNVEINQHIIIPARKLSEIAKSFPVNEQEVVISLPSSENDAIFGFSCGNRQATSRLLDQQYLSYEKLIPDTHNTIVNIDVSLFAEAIKRVALVAFRGAIITCNFIGDQLVISSGADEAGHAEETIPVSTYGQNLTIAFNAAYLSDGLQALTTKTVCMGLSSANKAVVMKNGPLEPITVSETDFALPQDDFIYLVMPTRIPN